MEFKGMAEKILTYLHQMFIKNLLRKVLAFILAVVIWYLVDNTLTATKTYQNIAVRVINLPEGKTIDGLQDNQIMNKKIALSLSGRRAFLERLSSSDFEVVIDAGTQPQDEWIITIAKRNLVPLVPEMNLQAEISKVSHKDLMIQLVNLSKETIPIFITQPVGEPPKGYQYLDVWPYQLSLTVSGPETTVSKLKARGVKLTFNLNDITKSELENLPSNHQLQSQDVVSFFVPADWKKVVLPTLSDLPVTIDDPDSKFLRIDFIRSELISIGKSIPVTVFYPTRSIDTSGFTPFKFSPSPLLTLKQPYPLLSIPLYAKGVSELFVQVVKDHLSIVLAPPQKLESKFLDWSVCFVNPKLLEDRYVSLLLSDISDEQMKELQPEIRQKYLRNRFRNYMNRFQLFVSEDKPLEIVTEVKNNTLFIQ